MKSLHSQGVCNVVGTEAEGAHTVSVYAQKRREEQETTYRSGQREEATLKGAGLRNQCCEPEVYSEQNQRAGWLLAARNIDERQEMDECHISRHVHGRHHQLQPLSQVGQALFLILRIKKNQLVCYAASHCSAKRNTEHARNGMLHSNSKDTDWAWWTPCDPSTQDGEARDLRVLGQSGLLRKFVSKKPMIEIIMISQ